MTLKELVEAENDPQVMMEYEGLLQAKNDALKELADVWDQLHAARQLQWAAERDRGNLERSVRALEAQLAEVSGVDTPPAA